MNSLKQNRKFCFSYFDDFLALLVAARSFRHIISHAISSQGMDGQRTLALGIINMPLVDWDEVIIRIVGLEAGVQRGGFLGAAHCKACCRIDHSDLLMIRWMLLLEFECDVEGGM